MTSKLLALAIMSTLVNTRVQDNEVIKFNRNSLIEGPSPFQKLPTIAQYKSDKLKVRSGSFKRNKRKSK